MRLYEIKQKIEEYAATCGDISVMEVCGTHTHNIRQYGIAQLLPQNIKLISGPGCPVCVTAEKDIARAILLAQRKNVIFCCFGDMLRVPSGNQSLLSIREKGANVRICLSPLDALKVAEENPQSQVIWYGIGFETTAPLSAALIEKCSVQGVKNLCVLSVHKTMPAALRNLIQDGVSLDALLCPGHVAAVTGAREFEFIPKEFGIPAAVSGFSAENILLALLALIKMKAEGKSELVNAYPQAVSAQGNTAALALLYKVFEPSPSEWRGLGMIPDSGLRLREEFSFFNAEKRFPVEIAEPMSAKGCLCAQIIRGQSSPSDCPLFGKVCTPETPAGACMVSSEGACAAWYKY